VDAGSGWAQMVFAAATEIKAKTARRYIWRIILAAGLPDNVPRDMPLSSHPHLIFWSTGEPEWLNQNDSSFDFLASKIAEVLRPDGGSACGESEGENEERMCLSWALAWEYGFGFPALSS
jgi:hypothetical protein